MLSRNFISSFILLVVAVTTISAEKNGSLIKPYYGKKVLPAHAPCKPYTGSVEVGDVKTMSFLRRVNWGTTWSSGRPNGEIASYDGDKKLILETGPTSAQQTIFVLMASSGNQAFSVAKDWYCTAYLDKNKDVGPISDLDVKVVTV